MSPSLRTMGFFMSDINFCNTKEQLNHLGEVVTGKTNGSPTGADIETSTLPYTGQIRKTLPALEAEYLEAIRNAGGEPLNSGVWAAGQTFTAYNQFMVYNDIPYKPLTTTPLPYGPTGATPDTNFVGPYESFSLQEAAQVFGNKNELSNSNFLTPSPEAITHPNATPESYVAGTQIFSGVYAGDSGCTITLIDGRVNCTAGDYQFKLANDGGLERVPAFTSSVSDYDGIPKTTGVSHALVADEYVVTVTPAAGNVFSVKLEQGSVATRHEISWISPKTISILNYISDGVADIGKAILDAEYGTLDLGSSDFSISSTSVSINTVKIKSSGNPKITILGSSGQEFGLKINTLSSDSVLITDSFTIDGDEVCAKPFMVENTIKGKLWISNNISSINAKQTALNGLAAGFYLHGGFNYVEMNSPKAKEINSTGGSFVASGVRLEQNGSSVSDRIVVNNPDISGVRPGNDGDGIALLQDYPFTILGDYEVNFGKFENCHKRAIKTQCWKTMVREPFIRRTEVHEVFGGNVDIDIQYGNGEIINPTLDYLSGEAFPANGIATLNGERGVISDRDGRGVNLTGGTATIRNKNIRIPYLFSCLTYDSGDNVVNGCSVRGFELKGKANRVCLIRPIASSTFNKALVFDLSFRDNQFEDVSLSFLAIDRSGTGYSFADGVNLIGNSILSGEIPKDENLTTQVGVSYNIVSRNDNIEQASEFFDFREENLADTSSFSKVIRIPAKSSVEITAVYASGAGDNYHAYRKSIIQCGDGAGEDLESNLSNLNSAFGGWGFSFSSVFSSGVWEVTISKPAGVSNVTGTLSVIAICAGGVN